MADTPSVVTPCRLASDTLLVAREAVQPMVYMLNKNLMVDLGSGGVHISFDWLFLLFFANLNNIRPSLKNENMMNAKERERFKELSYRSVT